MKKTIFLACLFCFAKILTAQNLSHPNIDSPASWDSVSFPVKIVGSYKQLVNPLWYPGATIKVVANISYSHANKDSWFTPSKTYTAKLNNKGEWEIPSITIDYPVENDASKLKLQVGVQQIYNGQKSNDVFFEYNLKRPLSWRKIPESKVIIKKDYKERIPLEKKNMKTPVKKQTKINSL